MNVLLIIADQFRADCLGSMGHPVVLTPTLDSLAAEGVNFNHVFCQSLPCGPSRMNIFSVCYTCSTGVYHNLAPMKNAENNLAQTLKSAGVRSTIIGYNDYVIDPQILSPNDPQRIKPHRDNFLPGFEVALNHEYCSPEYFEHLRRIGYPEHLLNYSAINKPIIPDEGLKGHLPLFFPAPYKAADSESAFVTDTAIKFLKDPGAKPWFLSLNYIKPHPPRICADPFHKMYADQKMPPSNRRPKELSDTHPFLEAIPRDELSLPEAHLREIKANYYGMISELDANLARLFKTMKASGQWNDTLVIFTSDHGEYLGDHYLLEKLHFYDETVRVPLIVRDPSQINSRGANANTFVELIDLAPTILKTFDVPIPQWMQGSPIQKVIADPRSIHKTQVHFEFDFQELASMVPRSDPNASLLWIIRDEDFKFILFEAQDLPPLLYDLKIDPHEQTNLANESRSESICQHYVQLINDWKNKYQGDRNNKKNKRRNKPNKDLHAQNILL